MLTAMVWVGATWLQLLLASQAAAGESERDWVSIGVLSVLAILATVWLNGVA